MIDETALLAFRAEWERRALGLILDIQREEQADVEQRGRGGFAFQRWLDGFFTIWRGIAVEWGEAVTLILESEEQKDARFFIEGNPGAGLRIKVFHEEEAVLREITEIVTRKSLAVVAVSESEWTVIGEGVWTPARAATMATTETAQATGWTQHAVAIRSPLQLLKIWQSIIDDRTRPTHLNANGQQRLLNEPFDVGAAQLQWPADAGGPLEEIINCRCWEEYQLAQPTGSSSVFPGLP